jgi:hypothetical protein
MRLRIKLNRKMPDAAMEIERLKIKKPISKNDACFATATQSRQLNSSTNPQPNKSMDVRANSAFISNLRVKLRLVC